MHRRGSIAPTPLIEGSPSGGRPSFNMLQNYSAGAPLYYFIFDLLVLRGRPTTVLAEHRAAGTITESGAAGQPG